MPPENETPTEEEDFTQFPIVGPGPLNNDQESADAETGQQSKDAEDSFESFPLVEPTGTEKMGAFSSRAGAEAVRSSAIIGGAAAGGKLGTLGGPLAPFTVPAGVAGGAAAGYFFGESVENLLGVPSVEEMDPDLRPFGIAGEVFGGSIPFMGLPLGAARTGARLPPSLVGNWLNRVVDAAGRSPGAFVAAEMSGIGGASVAGGLAENFAPGDPFARIGAEIAGGFFNPTRIVIASMDAAMQGVRRLTSSMSEAGRRTEAGRIVQQIVREAGEDPDELARLLRELDMPDLDLTSAQVTGSPALISLESKIASISAPFSAEAKRKAASGLEALRKLSVLLRGTGEPEAVRMAAEIRQRYFKTLLEARLRAAEARAVDAAARITDDTPAARRRLGEITNSALSESLADARNVESDLWAKIPRDIEATPNEIIRAYDNLRADMLPEEKMPVEIEGFVRRMRGEPVDQMPDEVRRLMEEAFGPLGIPTPTNGPPQATTTGELLRFRSRALALSRQARARGDLDDARMYGVMAEAALDDLSKVRATVPAPKQDLGFNQSGRIPMSPFDQESGAVDPLVTAIDRHINNNSIGEVLAVPTGELKATQRFLDEAGGLGDPVFPDIDDVHPVVARLPDGSLHIVDGHHRIENALDAGLDEVPVRVFDVDVSPPSGGGRVRRTTDMDEGLDDKLADILNQYTSGGLADDLRLMDVDPRAIPEDRLDEVTTAGERLNAFIRSKSLPETTVVYRGVAVRPDDVPKQGDVINRPNPVSASKDENVAETFANEASDADDHVVIFEMEVPEGTAALDVSRIQDKRVIHSVDAQLQEEAEILLPGGSQMRVVSVDTVEDAEGFVRHNVKLELIPQEDAPEVGQSSVQAVIDDARTFSRELNDTYTRTFAGSAMARTRTGAQRIPPELIMSRAIAGGKEAAELRLREIEEATRFLMDRDLGGPEVRERFEAVLQAQERLIRVAASEAIDPQTGTVSTRRMSKFVRDNGDLLDRFPEVKADLEEATRSQEALEAVRRANTQATRTIDRMAEFARVANIENPVDEVRRIMLRSNKTPIKDYNALARVAKRGGPEAVEGLRAATIDHAIERASTSSGQFEFSTFRRVLFDPIRPGQPSLVNVMKRQGVIDQDTIDHLDIIIQRAERIEEALEMGSALDELVGQPDAVFDFIVRVAGARAGAESAMGQATGATLVAAGAGSELFRKVFEKVPRWKIRDTLREAAENPRFMALLLEEAPTPKDKIRVANQLHSYLLGAGLMEVERMYNFEEPQRPTGRMRPGLQNVGPTPAELEMNR